jgi:peptidoglycan/LPS O-acetylase OafA/YrhL
MSDKKIFGTMNGLRGIAALMVVALHWSLPGAQYFNSFLAVDFFFALSGFVIAHSYEQRLNNGLSLRDFMTIRLVRLYPIYILAILLTIAAIILSFVTNGHVIDANIDSFHAIPFAIFMAPNPPLTNSWTTSNLYMLDVPAWSLMFEIIMNILYATYIRLWSDRKLYILLTFAAMALFGALLLNGDPTGGYTWANAHMGFLRALYSFPAGVFIYRQYRNGVSPPSAPALLIVFLFVILLMLPSAWGIPFCMLVGFPFLVALAAKGEPRGMLSPVFATLGTASYAIYVMHQPLHGFIAAAFYKFMTPFSSSCEVSVAILLVPLCVAVNRFYDAPVRKWVTHYVLYQSKTKSPVAKKHEHENRPTFLSWIGRALRGVRPFGKSHVRRL